MLLDTSGLFSYFDQGDANHARAAQLFDAADALLTHSYVLAEFLPLCNARRLNRAAYLAFAAELLGNPVVEIVWVAAGQNLFSLRRCELRVDARAWSGLIEALTTDKHFEQEGFQRLLTP